MEAVDGTTDVAKRSDRELKALLRRNGQAWRDVRVVRERLAAARDRAQIFLANGDSGGEPKPEPSSPISISVSPPKTPGWDSDSDDGNGAASQPANARPQAEGNKAPDEPRPSCVDVELYASDCDL
jgi:hypothetical protein